MLTLCIVSHQWSREIRYQTYRTKCCYNQHVFLYLCFLFPRVERKERARLKTVKFNAKPGVIDAKGVRK